MMMTLQQLLDKGGDTHCLVEESLTSKGGPAARTALDTHVPALSGHGRDTESLHQVPHYLQYSPQRLWCRNCCHWRLVEGLIWIHVLASS